MVQMGTGLGKTHVVSELPDAMPELPGQMLVLAHTEELVDQMVSKVRLINPTLRVDKEMAKHRADPSLADCIVASVASLGRKDSSRLSKYNWPTVTKIVTDEAHHSLGQTYINIYEASGILEDPTRLLLGVTATPSRGDGKGLSQIYQKISYIYSMRDGIKDGWLSQPRGVRVNTGTSLDHIKTIAGDYALDELADTVNTPIRNELIVRAWQSKGNNRSTVAFTVDIAHAKDLAQAFRNAGVVAEAIWGDDPDRKQKLEDHRAGKIKILTNCSVLVEGYDDWRIGCIILARPTKSSSRFIQMVGRGTRLEEGYGNLIEARQAHDHLTPGYPPKEYPFKQDCIIIDVVDSSNKLSLITLPTLMGLAANIDLQGHGVYDAAKKIEEEAKKYPHIDFTKLVDFGNIDNFIQEVNLFDVKFLPVVENNSDFTWYPSATGGYILMLPKQNPAQVADRVTIEANLFDRYEIRATIKGKKYKGERETIEDAFTAADGIIRSTSSEALKVLSREATWHKDPATEGQLKMLKKLYPGRAFPPDIDKGKASRLISSMIAGRA